LLASFEVAVPTSRHFVLM